MKALIFAAGLGSRLRPLTDHCPKALVKVGGVTLLERTINRLREAGFDDITVNVHHLGNQIIDFLNAHDNFGVSLHISDERDKLLDTGGGLLKAKCFLDGDEPFLVHNADIISDVDLACLYHHHLDSKALATLVVSHRTTSRYLLFDGNSRLQGWVNKLTGEVKPQGFQYDASLHTELAFSGIHVLSPSIFQLMERRYTPSESFSITPFYLSICKEAPIRGYLHQGLFFDIGKHDTLQAAESHFKTH